MTENQITAIVIDCGLKIHRALGPGLLENIYEECLVHELTKKGLRVERQVHLPLKYDGIKFPTSYRLDILIEDKIIVELKSVEQISDLHMAQILSYLKISNLQVGLLLNFNVELFKHGIKRVVNHYNPN